MKNLRDVGRCEHGPERRQLGRSTQRNWIQEVDVLAIGDLHEAGFVEVVVEAVGFGIDCDNLRTHQVLREGLQIRLRLDNLEVSHSACLCFVRGHTPSATPHGGGPRARNSIRGGCRQRCRRAGAVPAGSLARPMGSRPHRADCASEAPRRLARAPAPPLPNRPARHFVGGRSERGGAPDAADSPILSESWKLDWVFRRTRMQGRRARPLRWRRSSRSVDRTE